MNPQFEKFLAEDSEQLSSLVCDQISSSTLDLPSPDYLDRVWISADRPNRVPGSPQTLFELGRVSGTISPLILPVERVVEGSAGAKIRRDVEHINNIRDVFLDSQILVA